MQTNQRNVLFLCGTLEIRIKCSGDTVKGATTCLKEHRSLGSDIWVGSWGQVFNVYIWNPQLTLELSQWGPTTPRRSYRDLNHRGSLLRALLLLPFQSDTTACNRSSSHWGRHFKNRFGMIFPPKVILDNWDIFLNLTRESLPEIRSYIFILVVAYFMTWGTEGGKEGDRVWTLKAH